MRLIFWFLVAANFGLLVMRYGVGMPAMFRPPANVSVISDFNRNAESVERVKLLDELKTESPTPKTEEVKIPPKPLCRAVGPFEGKIVAESFVSRLSALDVKSKILNEQTSAGAGYWVYLEPINDKKLITQNLLDLQGRGIDSYVIPNGNLADGISLGMFSQLNAANKRILELKEMGYEAKFQKIERTYDEVWVVLGKDQDQKIGTSAWKMLLKGKNNLKEQQKVCLDVDSQ